MASTAFELKGKTVFVAGHRGMVGSALMRRLAREGAELLTVSRGEVDLRDQAKERGEALSKKDKASLEGFADSLDSLHKTLVVTEGGWISGQEELRERLGTLYGDVSFYDGRPTDSQIERMGRLQTELEGKQAEARLPRRIGMS